MRDLSNYSISPAAYLDRAKKRLLKDNAESLFYAAFELRCFVEARQDEYLDAQREYTKSVPKAYKIGDQGRTLERIFASNQIQYISWEARGQLILEAHHTPVTPRLRKGAEWLGNLLHGQMRCHSPEDKWWETTRNRVLEIYRAAWVCAQGTLPSPLMVRDGKTVGRFAVLGSEEELKRLLEQIKAGDSGVLGVRYLEQPPASWVCDL